MLVLLAYDIANPRRLRRVAEACQDYGIRLQKSLFECWLEPSQFDCLWHRLEAIADPAEDSIVAYFLDRRAASRRLGLGENLAFSLPAPWYLY